jgi:Bacterial PH domain
MPEMRASVPVWQRVPMVLVTAVMLWFVAGPPAIAIIHGQHVSIAPPSLIFVLVPLFLCYRLNGLSFRARGQELLIRNYFRTRRVPVAQIEGLDIGRASAGSMPTVRVLTSAAVVPIDVISVLKLTAPWPTAGHMARLEQHRRELVDWIAMAKTQADPGARTG